MRVLKDDVFSRRRDAAHGRGRSGLGLVALVMLAVTLLVLSRIDNPVLRAARTHFAELVAPVIEAAAVPLAPLRRLSDQMRALATPAEELGRLRAENQRLLGVEARARELERQLADLRKLARAVEQPATSFITGRVIVDASGPFARSVLFGAGREHGVKAGYPAISSDGVIGRVLESGPRAARILLLTDLNSRVPVLVGPQAWRAVLVGDNGPRPRLQHLPADAKLEPGHEVITSGIGGLFPRGLRVGTVAEDAENLRVDVAARLNELEHISVLFHESPALGLANDEQLTAADSAGRRGRVRRAAAPVSEVKPAGE